MDRAAAAALVQVIAVAGLLSGCTPGTPEVNGTNGITVLESEWLSGVEVWTSGPSMRQSQLEPTPGHRLLRVLFQLERPLVGDLDLSGQVLRGRSEDELSSRVRAFRLGVPESVKYRIREGGAPGNVWREAESGVMALLESDVVMLLSNPGGPYTLSVVAPDGDASESAGGPLAVDAVFEISSGAEATASLDTLWIELPLTVGPIDIQEVGAPESTPYSIRPEIKDPQRAKEIVQQHYPRLAWQAGVEGVVSVWVFVDTIGRVLEAQAQSGSNRVFEEAAIQAVHEFEFTPALWGDKKVPVWVAIPVVFEVSR